MKKSVYIDTTVPSYYFDERESLKYPCEITRKWWDEERRNFDVFISLETIAELERGNYPRKAQILELVQQLVQLEYIKEIDQIAEHYLDNYLMPKDSGGDATHLAYASFYKIDFLLTWNCNHLANANKKQHIKIINGRLGLFTPDLITPLELFTER